jgi:microcystin-dependent protein
MVMNWAGATAPPGWAFCDGASVATTVYPDLFAIIGTTYGSVGAGFYNLPSTGGRVVRGLGSAPYNTRGTTGGADSVILSTDQIPAHTHPITDPGHVHAAVGRGNGYASVDGANGNRASVADTASAVTGITGTGINTTTGVAVPTADPFIVIPYIIKTTNDHL